MDDANVYSESPRVETRTLEVFYDDGNPDKEIKVKLSDSKRFDLEEDGLCGAGYMESVLSRRLEAADITA